MFETTGRRDFLKSGIALAGATTLGSVGSVIPARATSLENRRLKLSLAAYSFRAFFRDGRFTMDDFIEFCDEQNLEGTELTSYFFDSENARNPDMVDDAYLRRLRLKCFKLGLDISGTAIGNNYVVADDAKRQAEVATTKKWIDKAATMGAPVIRIFGGGGWPEGATEDQVFEWVIPCLKEVTTYAETRGIALALENHGGFPETAVQTVKLVHAVDSPWLGVTLDTGNFRRDWYDQMAELVPYAMTVQVKTSLWSTAEERQKIATDPERIIKILKQGGYKGYVVLEYEDEKDPLVEIPRWLDRLRDLCS